MRPGSPAVEYTPIFDWSPPRSRKVSVIGFLAISAVLHAFGFYIFQIIYPATVALLPPPARVNIITPDSEEGRVLLRWIEAEDPALSSITQRSPGGANFAPPKAEHISSYLSREPVLKELPLYQPDLSVPSSHPPAPVPRVRAAASGVSVVTPTEVTFSAEVGPLGTPTSPPREFRASSPEPPQAAQFRVGINPRGEVRYCLLEKPSGDSLLDENARRHLLRVRFPGLDNGNSEIAHDLLWATATFEWGNDIVVPPPASAKSPAP